MEGRKSQLAFDLHSSQQTSKQFFKGNFVKEGMLGIGGDFKLSSDLQADLGVLAFRVFGTADKQQKQISTDMKVTCERETCATFKLSDRTG